VTALCLEQSEEWLSGRRYLEMIDLTQEGHPPSLAPEARTTALLVSSPEAVCYSPR
jgi:hypothetical protein